MAHYYAATHNMQPFFCMFFCVTMYATTNRADMMSINEMAAELVKLAGTQVEAARISGVSQSNISRLVAGEIGAGTKADTERKIKAALRKLRRRARADG
jgi:predicted XRE-type DNA-binding protein